MAVTDSEEVLEARMQFSPTMCSSRANSSRLAARSSTIASTTTWQGAKACAESTTSMRPSAASTAARCSLPRSASLCSDWETASRALCAAPGWASNTRVRTPLWASTCAMPRPMVPEPATPATRSARLESSNGVEHGREKRYSKRRSGGYNPPKERRRHEVSEDPSCVQRLQGGQARAARMRRPRGLSAGGNAPARGGQHAAQPVPYRGLRARGAARGREEAHPRGARRGHPHPARSRLQRQRPPRGRRAGGGDLPAGEGPRGRPSGGGAQPEHVVRRPLVERLGRSFAARL